MKWIDAIDPSMAGYLTGDRNPETRGILFALASFLVLGLLLPQLAAGTSLIAVYNRPYSGALATASVNSTTMGCAHASAHTLPFLNATSGIGGFRITVRAWACAKWASQSSNVTVQLVDRIPVTIPSGNHGVNVTWKLGVNATTTAYNVSRVCSHSSGACWDIADSHFYADAVVKDLTNGTIVSSAWNPASISGFAELDNKFGWVHGTHVRKTFESGVNLSGNFVATHKYVVITTVYGSVSADIGSAPSAHLVSSLDVSSPYGAKLLWIKIW